MRSSFIAATVFLVLGVGSGMFFREFTKANHFQGATQLSLVHAHLLVLGFVVFLLVLILDRLFGLAYGSLFAWFFWIYNAGLLLTAGAMMAHGVLTVLGEKISAGVAGIAGIGHILLTVALVLFLVVLGRGVFAAAAHDRSAPDPQL
ncbi:hypothetical protein ATY41_11700 [Leifsonia xyli subsp. xyli]|uniref:DUF2871 domain-containing protein n=2 Tax=Leifsonia xyli subsp. xyli TaxID=59736 RepID=Q6AGI1_LEIXX|nr:DUF2871 domain-containing protein [Leifsonia xyli]AAT88514.1 conserved hypothetical protein [Leifsonia xyli subsp. xyli str. CTCB07]ODA89935.1 hypothetical protein ATY41_11700 [Leifsonia xyli subsp. xyli]